MLQGECVRSPRLHGADKTQSGLDDAGLVHVHVPLSWALRGGRVLDSNDFRHKLQSGGRVGCQESANSEHPYNLIIKGTLCGGTITLRCKQ